MKFKFISGIALIAVLVSVALAWHRSTGSQSRESPEIKVVINPAKDGVVPIGIIQPTIVSSAPNKLDNLTYNLRNNSGKAVIAIALVKTISYEEDGKVFAQSRYSTMDSRFHSDVGGQPFLPGTQTSMESAGPLSLTRA